MRDDAWPVPRLDVGRGKKTGYVGVMGPQEMCTLRLWDAKPGQRTP